MAELQTPQIMNSCSIKTTFELATLVAEQYDLVSEKSCDLVSEKSNDQFLGMHIQIKRFQYYYSNFQLGRIFMSCLSGYMDSGH